MQMLRAIHYTLFRFHLRVSHRNMSHFRVPKRPLVLVLGATGTGKSNLAIQIAQDLQNDPSHSRHGWTGAEIINADAMQLYRGLPIITNKVSLAEQQGIPHHLLDHIGLDEEPWTVQKYVVEADRVIQDIRNRGKLPIVVGGTSYYVLGLLFNDALLPRTQDEQCQLQEEDSEVGYGKDAASIWPILGASTPEIYSKLQEVDVEMAKRWHPNDRRKIQRSLEIYLRTGQKASEIYQHQKQRSNVENGDLEFDNEERSLDVGSDLKCDPIVFWLEAENNALKDRLNRRVDGMVYNGLLNEAVEMDNLKHRLMEQGLSVDQSKGIWVSIGYKEMKPWAQAVKEQKADEKTMNSLKDACIEAVKAGTRQYAKRQNRFIRIRLANALDNAGILERLFLIDCTNPEKWTENSQKPALNIMHSFLDGKDLPKPSSLSLLANKTFGDMANNDSTQERVARRCESCDKLLMTEKEWSNHLNSRSHKRVLQGIRKRELNEARRQAAHITEELKPT